MAEEAGAKQGAGVGALQALGAIGLELGGAALGANFSARAAKASYERQKNLLMYGPTLRMRGLRKAGLNPILAASGGLGGGGQPSAAAVAPSRGPSVAGAASAALTRAQARVMQSQVEANNALVGKHQADADFARQRTMLTSLDVPAAAVRSMYARTPEGMETIVRGVRNASDPNQWQAMLMKRLLSEVDSGSGRVWIERLKRFGGDLTSEEKKRWETFVAPMQGEK